MTNEQTTLSKKITAGLILGWIFGILFGLTGIISVFSEPIPGIVMLVMAAVLLPPINKLVDKKWKFHLSDGIKVIIIIVGLIIVGSIINTSNTTKQQNSQSQIQQEQKQSTSNTARQKKETKPTNLKDKYICPELDKLFYEESTDAYILRKNCEPHPGFNESCDINRDYEQWVNDNCGIKFKISIAE